MPIPIGTLYTPLEAVTLPKDGVEGAGRTLQPQEFNKPMRDLMTEVSAGGEGSGPAALALLRACLPGVTDDELAELDEGRIGWIFAYCGRKLEEVEAYLKNAARSPAAATAASDSPPSARTTNTSTRSPASRGSSAKTGSRSRSSRSTARSTPSTV